MLYTIFTVGDKEYKLRLSAQETVNVEKRLGRSVLDVLLSLAPENMDSENISVKGMSMPLVGDIVTIIHGALQKYHHGFSLTDTYNLYDEYIDAGGSYNDFFGVMREILEVSGFLSKKAPEENKVGQETQESAPAA